MLVKDLINSYLFFQTKDDTIRVTYYFYKIDAEVSEATFTSGREAIAQYGDREVDSWVISNHFPLYRAGEICFDIQVKEKKE